jgi:hypothetical protein
MIMGTVLFGIGGAVLLGLPWLAYHDFGPPHTVLEWATFVETFFPSLLCFWVVALELNVVR